MRHLSKGWAKGPVILGILFTVLFALGMMAEEIHAASYPFKSVTIYADGTRTAKFICNGMSGFCCEAGAYSAYSGTATLTRLENTTNAAHCAYWYGYCRGWTTGTNAHKLARLLSYCMGHGTGGDYKESTMRSLLKRAREEKVPAGFECWHGSPSGSSRQDFIVWKYPKGKLKVTKKSSDTSISNKGTYTLAGMTIKVYSDAGCKNCVKTLTTKKNGTIGGAFQLPVGTYYVKETKVPGSTGYKLNGKVHKIKIGEGKTASVSIGNKPDTGTIRVRKKVTGKDGEIEGFRFIIKGKKSGKKYVLTTRPDGTAKISGLPFGKYTITEDLTEEQQKHYVDQTGPQTVVLAKGSDQEITVARENLYEQQQLRIVKRTEDGGPVKGFTFRVSWLLANSLQITGEEVVKAAAPKVELTEEQSLGIWQIEDENVIGQINEDAKAGCTGSYEVVLRNTVTTAGTEEPAEQEPSEQEPAGKGPEEGEKPEAGEQQNAGDEAGEDLQDPAGIIVTTEEDGETLTKEEIRIKVQLELCSRASAPDTSGDSTGALSAAEHKEDRSGACLIEHEDLVFYGAADKGDREVVTDAAGQYAMEDVQPGEYTVTEIMDEKQKRRYRQPASQTKKIEADGEETYLFTFVNEPILIPVRLQKIGFGNGLGGTAREGCLQLFLRSPGSPELGGAQGAAAPFRDPGRLGAAHLAFFPGAGPQPPPAGMVRIDPQQDAPVFPVHPVQPFLSGSGDGFRFQVFRQLRRIQPVGTLVQHIQHFPVPVRILPPVHGGGHDIYAAHGGNEHDDQKDEGGLLLEILLQREAEDLTHAPVGFLIQHRPDPPFPRKSHAGWVP